MQAAFGVISQSSTEDFDDLFPMSDDHRQL